MNRFFTLMLILALITCSATDHGDNGGSNIARELERKINDWRARECYSLSYLESGYTNMAQAQKIADQVEGYIGLVPENGADHWQTSCELTTSGEGDCEDIAILIYRYFREAGFDDRDIGILITHFNNTPGAGLHVVPYFYVADTMYVIDIWQVQKFTGTILMTFNTFETKNYGL